MASTDAEAVDTFDALPDCLLAAVFLAAGRKEGPAVTLVCRRWCRVAWSEPALWRSFVLQPPRGSRDAPEEQRQRWLAATCARLCRVGRHVRSADFDCSMLWRAGLRPAVMQVPAMLASLPAQQLSHLRVECWEMGSECTTHEAAALAATGAHALRTFPHLTGLELSAERLSPADAAPLRQLTALRSLCLLGRTGVPEAVAAAAAQLPGLTDLRLVSNGGGYLPPADAFAGLAQALPRLRHLQVYYRCQRPAGSGPVLVLPAAAGFPALQTFDVYCSSGAQMGGIQLQSCTYELQGGGRGGTPPAPASAALDLTLWRGEGGGGLARVLVAVLPRPAAAAAALARLSLDGGSLGVGRCGGCAAQLAGLTALSLARCDAEPASGLAELLGELLPQAPGLRSLSLANYPGEGRVPAALLGLSGLQELTLQQLGLESLPPGAYLEGLTSLRLRGNVLMWLPASLRAAASLRILDLDGCPLELSPASVRSVLRHLPLLRELRLGTHRAQPAAAMEALRREAPLVKVQCREEGRLAF